MASERQIQIGMTGLVLVFGATIGVASIFGYRAQSQTPQAGTAPPNAAASTSTTNLQKGTADVPNTATSTATASAAAGSSQSGEVPKSTGVFINQREITEQQVAQFKQLYGMAPPPGRYWYDARSGLYGIWGFEAAGYIRPGHEFAPLSKDASRGDTGVIINGREINMAEAMFIQKIFGVVYRGNWWLDGNTGNIGLEGNPMPIANVVIAMQQAQRSGGGGGAEGYRWRDNINNFSGGAENGCVWVNMPGGSYTGSGC